MRARPRLWLTVFVVALYAVAVHPFIAAYELAAVAEHLAERNYVDSHALQARAHAPLAQLPAPWVCIRCTCAGVRLQLAAAVCGAVWRAVPQ